MCNDIQKGEVFGKVVARIHVIEFQKRGQPHAYMLLILDEKDKPKTIAHINLMVSAEMPDREIILVFMKSSRSPWYTDPLE